MQIVSNGDNLQDLANSVFLENLEKMSSAELAQRVVKVNESVL